MVPVPRKVTIVVLSASCMLCGCQDNRSSLQIRVPLDRQYILDDPSERPIKVSLPMDQPFNIHTKRSNQNPGLDGTAQGHSDATAAGRASCSVEAANGGSALAEFTIGHRIANQTDYFQNLSVELDCRWQHALHTSTDPTADTIARADLQILVLDAKGKILATIPALKTDSDQIQASAELLDHRKLSVSLEPKLRYDIILTGKVEAQSAAGQEASARLEVNDLKINLSFCSEQKEITQPAP
ncbi:MAG: hypothetical protein GXY44_03880 [Phycisphaerales bacterium]|nr:hypothetical protein [Phycisphaerales bacterium]